MQRLSIFLLLIFVFFSCADKKKEVQKQIVKNQQPSASLSELRNLIGNDYLIDDQHSYIGFKIKYFGFSPVRGRFNEFDGTVFYDENNLENLSVTIAIDVNSINTGNTRRDNDLKGEDTWFNATDFPIIFFQSDSIFTKKNGDFDVKGKLTIKGITKWTTIAFQKPTALSKDWAGNDQVDFSGKLTIDRQDFDVFGGDFWSSVMENGLTQLSDEVEIELDIHCRRPDYQIRYLESDSLSFSRIVLDQIKLHGIEKGIKLIEENKSLTSGNLSTIGYTLNAWGMHDEALQLFEKRAELYPEKLTTWNQIGITNLLKSEVRSAWNNFDVVLEADSSNSRALEYLRLMGRMKTVN